MGMPSLRMTLCSLGMLFFAKKLDPETGQLLDDQGRPQYRYNTRFTFSQQINGQEPIIEKLDAHTVRFTTPEVYAPFLLFGGGQTILPKHALQAAFDNGSLLDQWSLQTAIKQPWSILSQTLLLWKLTVLASAWFSSAIQTTGRSIRRDSGCLIPNALSSRLCRT